MSGDLEPTASSATELAAAMRARRLSPVEVVDAHLARIEQYNRRLNAVVTVHDEEARAEAAAAERALASGAAGALLGVPFTVKDAIATQGVRSTCGSRLLAGHVPTRDATCVARLRAAGAILLGKTNCPEFSLGLDTDNVLFGRTRSPWGDHLSPGGSSGGESAAIAAGLSPIGIGSDFGGSLRWPAQCTGVVAIRPTLGRVPASGHLPSAGTVEPALPNLFGFQGRIQAVGPLARSVDDLALLLELMSGPDDLDASAVPVAVRPPGDADLRELSFAWFEGEGSYPVRADLVAVLASVAAHLEGLGFKVVHRLPPGLDRAEDVYSRLRAMDGLTDLRALARGRAGELSPFIVDLLVEAVPGTVPELLRASAERDALRASLLEFMRDHQLLLLPVAVLPAVMSGQTAFRVEGVEVPYWKLVACCRVISLFGLPAAVVPCGRSHDGLPVGIQVVGRPFAEHEVLAAARLLEREFGGAQVPPRRADVAPGA